ncbi:hypothetical protein X777_04280 [Ooceraea biroi]|uniref:Uncharacterized protein n=1 Tax=Ooceraea biroi TaxID=2015173 RepID=A0A026WIK2_OOCBI|nr:hypothetical protein X777_04280 [Ooceraea biroi]
MTGTAVCTTTLCKFTSTYSRWFPLSARVHHVAYPNNDEGRNLNLRDCYFVPWRLSQSTDTCKKGYNTLAN